MNISQKRANTINRIIAKMEKDFAEMEQRIKIEQAWQPYRLRLPKRVRGKWYWPSQTVYRRYHTSPGGGFYEYGDVFDYLKHK